MQNLRPIIFITFILICITTVAQDYQIIKSNQTAFYQANSLSNIIAVKTDSIDMIGQDSIFHMNKNIDRNEQDPNCSTPFGYSIFGSIVSNSVYGSDFIINDPGEIIRIIRNATLNQSWLVMQNVDSLTITATITAIYETNFLNVTDSVKQISFEVLDTAGNIVNHFLNSNTIELSKNYGLISTFNFRDFPDVDEKISLVGLSNPDIGIQNLTTFDVFDFNIGDEIHSIRKYSNFVSIFYYTQSQQKFISRQDYSDSIAYEIELKQFTKSYNNNIDTDTLVSTNSQIVQRTIERDVDLDLIPGVPYKSDYDCYTYCTMYNFDYRIKSKLSTYAGVCQQNVIGDCWQNSIMEGADECNYDYYEGLGGPFYYCTNSFISQTFSENKLVYYKKGNETWGTPYNIVVSNNPIIESKIQVFPNKISDFLYIKVEDKHLQSQFYLYDSNGKMIKQMVLNDYSNQLNFNHLQDGIYFYKISNAAGSFVKSGKVFKL